jgi:hypothetical protein
MHPTVSSYLEDDHVRIEMALRQATSSGDRIQPEAYAQFRGALLRHIGMEEKILFPAIRNATAGNSLPGVDQLHLDHGALAALLVPTPTKSILDAIRTILQGHNEIEEGPEGIYRQFERLPGIDADGILARLQAAPLVALNPHVDNGTAVESMRAAVRRAGYSFDL